MTVYRFTAAAVGGLIVLGCQTGAFSQEIGDAVRATGPTELKVEDEVVATVANGDELQVRKVSGRWLWVQTAAGDRGWVRKEQVQLISPPTAAAAPAPAETAAEAARPTRSRAAAAERGRVQTVEGTASDAPWLTTIGVLAGQNIYTTYAYIGAIADGLGNKTYTADQVQQLMAEVTGMTDVARKNLQGVRDSTIVEQDRAAIDDVLSILKLLSDEAGALSRYAQSGSDADLEAYDQARTKVWPKVKAMLELE